MARYIKANYKVAQHLRLEKDRNQLQDGNYLLWQADMLAFGKLIDLPQTLEQIGGLALQAHEAREEQDGTVLRELPVATDPLFIIEPAKEEAAPEVEGEQQPGEEAGGEQTVDPAPETQTPAEDPGAEQQPQDETPAAKEEPEAAPAEQKKKTTKK